jgi:hypothetical protein
MFPDETVTNGLAEYLEKHATASDYLQINNERWVMTDLIPEIKNRTTLGIKATETMIYLFGLMYVEGVPLQESHNE